MSPHDPAPHPPATSPGPQPFRRALALLRSAILEHPGGVLLASLVTAALALVLGMGVEFRTSRSDLAGEADPDEARLRRVLEETGSAGELIAALEVRDGAAVPPAELRRIADRLAGALAASPLIERIFHRVDPAWIEEHGLSLIDPGTLGALAAALDDQGAILEDLARHASLAGLHRALARRIEDGRRAGAARGQEGIAAAEQLAALLEREISLLGDGASGVPDLGAWLAAFLAGPQASGRTDGYLANREGSVLYLFVTPRSGDDALPALERLVADVRARGEAALDHDSRLTLGLTGDPAITVEEMRAIRRDTWLTSALAVLGVTLLTFAVFRWRVHALLVLAALAVGLAWSFGAVALQIGYLNMITSAFISTLVGVGVAYGIHPVSEYELHGAHGADHRAALCAALHNTGGAVAASACTTAAAFYSILLMDFRGFAELGLVAGTGTVLCLIAFLVTLPAMLILCGRRLEGRAGARAPRQSLLDRLWVERGAEMVCRAPRTVSAASLLLTVALGWAAWGVKFDTNILDLLPAGAESLRVQRRMLEETDFSARVVLALADDRTEIEAMRERAAREPAIARLESALQFIPADPAGSAAALASLSRALDRVRLPERLRPPQRADLADSFTALEAALAGAVEDSFAGGAAPITVPLEKARASAARGIRLARQAPPGAEAGWARLQDDLLAAARHALDGARRAAAAPPATLDSLPPALAARFVTPSGRLVAYLHPAGDVFEPTFLDSFVAAVQRVHPEATGFPVVFRGVSARITEGFLTALLAGTALVALILVVDYRRPGPVLLALLPLGIGMVWMLGGMRLLGVSYNFANLVAIPLIVGIGVDNGVHIVHRLRVEGEAGMNTVLRHTCRAILIAGLTTMVGFGSLSLASHRGLASLGIVLLLGVGACVIAAVVVLPNLLVASGRYRT